MTTIIGIALALAVFVAVPMAVTMNVGGNTSKLSSEAGVVTAMGTTVQEAAVRSVTIGDGSVTQSGRVGVRSLSSAIRVGHIITTERSAYLEAVRPEPQSWPTTRWSCAQIAEAAARQGFPNPALVASIAMAESGGRSDAMAVNPRERSVGVMQVNTKVHTAWSDECLRSLECSLAVAYRLSRGGMSWTPWSAFNEGKHEGRCS